MKRSLPLLLALAAGCLVASTAAGFGQARDRRNHKRPRKAASRTQRQQQQTSARTVSGEYVPVHAYDPARNAGEDIRAAVAEAGRAGKRVLVEVGGEWCIWCHIMDAYFEKNPELLDFREKNFLMVMVNYSEENKNEAVLSNYPAVTGYPHIFVLERNGKLLHSQDTGKLEAGKSYDLTKFMDFLKAWAPPENKGAGR
jgi:thiol:disulfide interchange protein